MEERKSQQFAAAGTLTITLLFVQNSSGLRSVSNSGLTADGVAAGEKALLLVLVVFDLAFFFHPVFEAGGKDFKYLILFLLKDRFAGQLLASFVLGSRGLLLLDDLKDNSIAVGIERS